MLEGQPGIRIVEVSSKLVTSNGGRPVRNFHRMLVIVAAAALVLVVGSAIAAAVREQSWAPLASVAWLPAVLAGGFYRKDAARPCLPRLRRQSRAEGRVQAR
jgi:hypothetical protein